MTHIFLSNLYKSGKSEGAEAYFTGNAIISTGNAITLFHLQTNHMIGNIYLTSLK